MWPGGVCYVHCVPRETDDGCPGNILKIFFYKKKKMLVSDFFKISATFFRDPLAPIVSAEKSSIVVILL